MANSPPNSTPAYQAAMWLVYLKTPIPSPDDPYPDAATRNAAFLDWLKLSPTHLLLFLELVEIEHRLRRLDSEAWAEIRKLIRTGS